jgi:hypothetical protein
MQEGAGWLLHRLILQWQRLLLGCHQMHAGAL